MKHIFWIVLLTVSVSCRTDDPFGIEPAATTTVCGTRAEMKSPSVPVQHVTMRNIGGIVVGEKIINSFSVSNMRDAFMTLYWRRPINPTDGRINEILEELKGMSAYDINYTHYYLKITPHDMDEVIQLKKDTTLFFSPIPFDRKIEGTGTLPQQDAEYDAVTDQIKITGPIESYYTIIPITESLPTNTKYEILDHLYIPYMLDDRLAEAAHTPVISYTFCNLLVEQAEYLSGAKTIEELYSEKQWYPSGNIKVFDNEIYDYVGVPSIKVHIYNSYGYEWVYTDKDGFFRTEREMKGPVTYRIEWATRDYVIKNSAGYPAYYYAGSNMTYPLKLNIDNGEMRGIATVARALSSHYYGTNDWERICDFHKSGSLLFEPFQIFYRHSYNKKVAGEFVRDVSKRIIIYGRDSLNTERPSISILNTTFHELGHAAMFYRCKKNNINYDKFHKVMKESWGEFCGWYMTRSEYLTFGHDPYNKEIKYLNGQLLVFESPNDYNGQRMNLQFHKNYEYWKYYTPLFIDLIDDSNQMDYYAITNPFSENVYPDDRIAITNYVTLYGCIGSSRNTTQLKSKLLEHANELGLHEKDINDYFAFYEQ